MRQVRLHKRRSRVTAAAGVSSGTAAAIISAIAVGPSQPLMVAVGAFVGSVAMGVSMIVQPRPDDETFPRAAAAPPPACPFARGKIVAAESDLQSPASGLWVAAWSIALTLTRRDGPRVVFRDAATTAITIELDDGTRARALAGPWRAAGELVPLLDVDDAAMTSHLREVDPAYEPHDALAPFRHDTVHELLLRVGDRVELCGGWEPVPDGEQAMYRDVAPSTLRPVAWPAMRRTR